MTLDDSMLLPGGAPKYNNLSNKMRLFLDRYAVANKILLVWQIQLIQ
jgi:hypothetical protein